MWYEYLYWQREHDEFEFINESNFTCVIKWNNEHFFKKMMNIIM